MDYYITFKKEFFGKMKEIYLCKYGELALKGLNKNQFEATLVREIKHRIAPLGKFDVRRAQSTIYVEPLEEIEDADAVFDALLKIFGLATVCRAAETEKDMEYILDVVRSYVPPLLAGKRTFRANAKRADKRFPLKSPEFAAEVGGAVLVAMNGRIGVSMDTPEATVTVEIREEHAYVHADAVRGAGGMPIGTAGRAMLLLSGGIDSP